MLDDFKAQILAAQALTICGGGSKQFYGNPPRTKEPPEKLDTRGYSGIIAYEPTELYITAKCGTPLHQLEAALEEKGQYLACEPPHFATDDGDTATIGGAVAAGLSGPRRGSVGRLRDFVLGVKMLDGQARELNFGGRVIKNVAGYDLSRLMTGSLGTLGLLLELTLKVQPRPVADLSLSFALPQQEALKHLRRWAAQPLPIVSSCWQREVLSIRLAGAQAAVDAAQQQLQQVLGTATPQDSSFWQALRDQGSEFFTSATMLWRLSLPPQTEALALPGETLIEWGGGLRWLVSDAAADEIRATASALGGSATLFRAPPEVLSELGAFPPLSAPLQTLQRRLKMVFDPRGVFNPGRLYPEF